MAAVAAKPGYIGEPIVSTYAAAPVVTSYVKSVPTSISHSSSSVVHSSAHIAQPVVAPVVKTHLTTAPVIKSYVAPIAHTYSAPLSYSSYHHDSPLAYNSHYGYDHGYGHGYSSW